MKNKYTIKFILVFCYLISTFVVNSQQVNTMYFMDNVPTRNYLNPAFQPLGNFYLGLPVIGYSQFSFGNNSLALNDIIYKQNGQTILFKNPKADYTKFFNTLKPTILLNSDFQINLLDFGFRTGKSFWSFSLTEKVDGQLGIPKDFMKLLIYGTPDLNNNIFDFKNFGVDMSVYTEAGIGFSRKMNDEWTIGAKLKLNYGTANFSTVNQNIDLSANYLEWKFNGNGVLKYASPVPVIIGNDFQSITLGSSSLSDWIKPMGMGAGVDLGFTYKPINNLTISGALTDFGFINWNRNVRNVTYKSDFSFTGFGSLNNSNFNFNIQTLADTILKKLTSSFSNIPNPNPDTTYRTYTVPKLNIGLEYGFFENKLSVGLLSRTMKHRDIYSEELTASVNGRPIDWFNMSLSYSVLNGRLSNMGAGLGIRTGFVHWLLSADYIPLNYAALPINQLSSNFPSVTVPIAYNSQGFNFALGVNLVFGYRKDADKDGVVDRKDKCPETPFGVIVDKKGCPVDTDGDGVPDYLDKCPKTPKEAYSSVDEKGCPKDTDGDGVPDYLDKCPDTPKAAIGRVDKNGCPLDTDKDGVPDYLDKCPNTPLNIKVDSNGCPVDTDGDGVPDYLDKCPDTPKAAYAFVDKNGCPLDTDGDGVPDYLDKCPTMKGSTLNNGCEEVKVETKQEVKPEIKPVTKPIVQTELKSLFQKALQGIQFESGNDRIMSLSHKILNQIAGVLIANPTYLIEIRGFTDNVGNSESNKTLSIKRANAVKKYMVSKGVNASRITANGYGDTLPVASNKTAKGRALNRRVEFIASYIEITFQ